MPPSCRTPSQRASHSKTLTNFAERYNSIQRRRQRRKVKQKKKKIAGAQFIKFAQLPPELRQEIWRLAIPSRVIELDIPDSSMWYKSGSDTGPYGYPMCYPRHTFQRNAAKPVVSQVCYEAREVVHKYGCYIEKWLPPTSDPRWTVAGEDCAYVGEICLKSDRAVWCSPGIDSMHLSWGPGDALFDYYSRLPKQPMQLLESCRDSAQHLSVDFDQFHILGQRIGPIYVEELLYFQPGQEYRAIMMQTSIHLSWREVTESGLFGNGEERVVILDTLDTAKIALYVKLLYRSCSRFDKGQAKYLNNILMPRKLAKMTKKWRAEMTKLWIYARWVAKGDVRGGIASPFVPLATSLPYWPVDVRDRAQLFTHDLNLDIPWVSQEINDMPVFTPAVMFRFCESTVCKEMLEKVPVYRNCPEAIKRTPGSTAALELIASHLARSRKT